MTFSREQSGGTDGLFVSSTSRMRLDQYISERDGISRNRAKMYIHQGSVSVAGRVVFSPSYHVDMHDEVIVLDSDLSGYVSRSALKLKYFLDDHPEILIHGKICVDVGASTGGFTQVLLQRGASRVYAVDVGTDQLHPTLQDDDRIINIPQTDIRDFPIHNWLSSDIHTQAIGWITVDVSFISVMKVLPSIHRIIQMHGDENTCVIVLWKPQFEVGRNHCTKKGVVKNAVIQKNACDNFFQQIGGVGFSVLCHQPSGLVGEEGNQELFVMLRVG